MPRPEPVSQVQGKVYASGKAPGLTALAQGRSSADTSSQREPGQTCALELHLHFPKVNPDLRMKCCQALLQSAECV